MSLATKGNQRLALLFAIFLAVFSTGIVIAHQCKSISSDQVAMVHQSSDANSMSTVATKSLDTPSNRERLIDGGCVALFIVVLLLGRKLLDLRAPRNRLNRFMAFSHELVPVNRPQVFQLALSRPQLGIIRI